MTKIELKQYHVICQQIQRLDRKIQDEESREPDVLAGKVSGSSREFPYLPVHLSVQMYDPKQLEASKKKILRLQQDKKRLEAEKRKIEEFISAISDIHMRMIFQYHFLDGVSQEETGEILGYTQSSVSKKINEFLKDS